MTLLDGMWEPHRYIVSLTHFIDEINNDISTKQEQIRRIQQEIERAKHFIRDQENG